jgi:hypothetical protein
MLAFPNISVSEPDPLAPESPDPNFFADPDPGFMKEKSNSTVHKNHQIIL